MAFPGSQSKQMLGRIVFAAPDPASYKEHRAVLRHSGWLIHQVSQGTDPAAMARSHVPDLFLLDMDWPGIDTLACVQSIRQDPLTRDVIVVLLCRPTAGKARLQQYIAAGVWRIWVAPLAPEAMREHLEQVRRELIEPRLEHKTGRSGNPGAEDDEEDHPSVAQASAAGASSPRRARPVKTNNSLLERDVLCPFHDEGLPFLRYTLRIGRVLTDSSFLDIPLYTGAVPGADFINYHLLNVVVCPLCLFASNNGDYFIHPADPKHKAYAFSDAAISAMAASVEERKKLAAGASADLFSERRTADEALRSYELAIHSSRTLYDAANHEFPLELMRMANCHLRMAHLLESAGRPEAQQPEHYAAALDLLKQAFPAVEGINLYKVIYQLVAVGIYLGEDRTAVRYMDHFRALEREAAVPTQERALLQRYLHRCQTAWEDRTLHRAPFLAPPEPEQSKTDAAA